MVASEFVVLLRSLSHLLLGTAKMGPSSLESVPHFQELLILGRHLVPPVPLVVGEAVPETHEGIQVFYPQRLYKTHRAPPAEAEEEQNSEDSS